MSDSIENLLVRNLHEVFGKRESARRTAAIEPIFDRDCLFSDPRGRHVGRCGSEDAVVTLQAQFPSHVFSQIGSVDALQDSGRLVWSFFPPHEPRRITGLDVAVVNAGRSLRFAPFSTQRARDARASKRSAQITETKR